MVAIISDEQLAALQERIMQETIDAPAELENLIVETAERVASEIALKNGTSRMEFQDEVYTFKAVKKIVSFKEIIYMVVVNEAHRKMGGSRYRPYTVTVEVDNSFSYLENLQATVETFLRHITGTVAAQELEG